MFSRLSVFGRHAHAPWMRVLPATTVASICVLVALPPFAVAVVGPIVAANWPWSLSATAYAALGMVAFLWDRKHLPSEST